jgi:purine-binding chemotaxis protein CheW
LKLKKRVEEVMTDRTGEREKALIVGLRDRICAVPLSHVIEIMRPVPVERVAGAPSFVMGVAVIRGIPTPVVDLGAVLGTPNELAQRFVTVRVGDRQVALSVNAVLGVRSLEAATMIQELPPLLRGAAEDVVEMIGALDEQTLMVLRSGWELPHEVWQALTAQEAVS